MDVMMLLY